MSLARFGLDMNQTAARPSASTTRPPETAPRAHVSEPAPGPVQPDRPGFLARVEAGARQILAVRDKARAEARQPTALVCSDMDVDGITSHTIMRTVLERQGYDVVALLRKKFDDDVLAKLLASKVDLLVITDHASPARDTFGDRDVIVIDHHKPPDPGQDHSHQIHPMLYGLNGSTEICSAGIAYLVARALDPDTNRDMALLGVIGSAGDMMDTEKGRFIGLTADEVLADAIRHGLIEKKLDIRLYGRHGRTLKQLIAYADDPGFRGLSKNADAVQSFLFAQGHNPEDRWYQLAPSDQKRLVTELLDRATDPTRLLGECYEVCSEAPGAHLRDVREYATVINGSSRYEMPEPVIAMLLGDRGTQYEIALDNYLNHKRNIVKAIQLVQDLGVTRGQHLQWFHVQGMVRHTIVGSVAGAVQSRFDPDRPMIAFAHEANDPEAVKVSGRGHRALCQAGLDLSRVMREAGAAVGGKGGGHDVAAGATIPAGAETAFLAAAEDILREQIGHLHCAE